MIKTNIGDNKMTKYLGDILVMVKDNEGSAKRSNEILKGAVGTLYGWVVCVV